VELINKKSKFQMSLSKYLPPSCERIKVERNPNPIEEKLFALIVSK